MLTMGVDIGSTASKAVILEDGKRIMARQLVAAGTGTRGPAEVYKRRWRRQGWSGPRSPGWLPPDMAD